MWRRLKRFPFLPAVILLALNVRLVTSGLTWVGVAAFAITVIWFGFEFIRWLTHRSPEDTPELAMGREESPDEAEEDLVSIVYFLSEPRTANESVIRESVSTALDLDFEHGGGSENFVLPLHPPDDSENDVRGIQRFLVRIARGSFVILLSDSPYIDRPGDFAEQSIRDKRLRSAVESHRAWLSVDLMEEADSGTSRLEAYRIIGRILCALAGPDCLAIYSPELQRCNEFDLSLLEILGSDRPLDLFEEPTFEPIIEISDSNPRMAEAVAEAKSRWPEFVEEFERASTEDRERFIVKAEFREGDTCEYMWVSVARIEPDRIEGVLMNDPHELLDIHRGAVVRIEIDRLNDWIYTRPDGKHVGGFTLDVLAEGDDT